MKATITYAAEIRDQSEAEPFPDYLAYLRKLTSDARAKLVETLQAIDPTVQFPEYDPMNLVANETMYISPELLAVLKDPAQCPPIVKGVLTQQESEAMSDAVELA